MHTPNVWILVRSPHVSIQRNGHSLTFADIEYSLRIIHSTLFDLSIHVSLYHRMNFIWCCTVESNNTLDLPRHHTCCANTFVFTRDHMDYLSQ